MASAADVDEWWQWRGPSRDAQITPRDWPSDLSAEHLSLEWSVDLSPSYSSPIVADDRVFVTETRGESHEVVRAFDRRSGRQLWATEWEGAMQVPFFAAANGSWIRATPAYDGERLYVAGMRDVLVCLRADTGEIEWKIDFVADMGSELPSFGFVSSPLMIREHLYVQAAGSFLKLDKASGDVVWRTLQDGGGTYGSAFSSPVYATLDGEPQLVVQTRSKLTGVAPDDGRVLWSQEIPAFRGMNILTPTIIDDLVFTSSYGGRSTAFSVTRSNGVWQVRQAWQHKSQGYMSSPVVVDGQIYLHLRNQRLACLDARTGAERWTTTPFGKYWSMVANGDRILALDERGELLLIGASPEKFQLVDRREVAENSWAHLAVAGDQLFVRDLNALKVFTWR